MFKNPQSLKSLWKNLRKIVNENYVSSFASPKLNSYFWSSEVGETGDSEEKEKEKGRYP